MPLKIILIYMLPGSGLEFAQASSHARIIGENGQNPGKRYPKAKLPPKLLNILPKLIKEFFQPGSPRLTV